MVIQGQQLLHGDQRTFSQKNGSGHHTPLGSLLAVELAALAACCALDRPGRVRGAALPLARDARTADGRASVWERERRSLEPAV